MMPTETKPLYMIPSQTRDIREGSNRYLHYGKTSRLTYRLSGSIDLEYKSTATRLRDAAIIGDDPTPYPN